MDGWMDGWMDGSHGCIVSIYLLVSVCMYSILEKGWVDGWMESGWTDLTDASFLFIC